MAENNKSDLELKKEPDSSFEDEPMPSKSKSTKENRIRQQGECVNCKRHMKIEAKQMCSTCYRNSLEPTCCCLKCMAVARVSKEGFCRKCSLAKSDKQRRENTDKYRGCKECKQTKLIKGHGLCNMCYQRSRQKVKKQCEICGQMKILKNKTVCGVCYSKKLAKTNIRMCKNCGEMRPHESDQMCKPCYHQTRREDKRKHKECVRCGQTKFIEGHGMCPACYSKDKVRRLKLDTSKHKECSECRKTKLIHAREMCRNCYEKIFYTPKRSAKKRLAKQLLVPKPEPISSEDELDQRSVSPIDIEEFKTEPTSSDDQLDQRSVSPISIDEFKMERLSESDDQQPGPSWKF